MVRKRIILKNESIRPVSVLPIIDKVMPDDLEKYLVESQNPPGHNESDKMYPTRN